MAELLECLPRAGSGMNGIATRLERRPVQCARREGVVDHQRAAGARQRAVPALDGAQPVRADDEHEVAARERRRALIGRQVTHFRRQGPDGQLAIADHLVDGDREPARLRVHDEERLPVVRHFRVSQAQQRADVLHRDELFPIRKLHAAARNAERIGTGEERGLDRRHRDADVVLAGPHHQDR